jgi:hypothetical protein
VVSRTLFSFRTNKRIFDSFITVHDLEQWHRIMRRLTLRSRYPLGPEVAARYNAACHAAIIDVLRHGKHSDCQAADPTGLRAIALAKEVRWALRTLDRSGRLTQQLRHDIDLLNERRELPSLDETPLLQASAAMD